MSGRKSSSSIINFLSLVVGFTVLSIILLMAYNFFFGGTGEPANTVASEDGGTTAEPIDKTLLTNDLSADAFAKKIAIAQREDLVDYLERTTALGPSDERVPARIERNRRRVMAAEQLLLQDCTDEEYTLAVKSKLLALSSIYNTSLDGGFEIEVTEDADELKKFAQTLCRDEDDTLRLDARLTVAGIDLIESAKSKGAELNVDQVANSILELLKDFPAETKVVGYLQMVFPAILNLNAPFGLQLTEKLLARGKEFQEQHQAQLFRNLYDVAKLSTTDVKAKLANVFVGGPELKQELISIADELASDIKGGETLLNELEMIAHWMEQEREYAGALNTYQKLLETAPQRATPELSKMASSAGRDGKVRCELVGKKIGLRGTRLAGGVLNSAQYEGSFVVILFLTFEKLNAEALLNDLDGELTNLTNRRVKFIAVNLDKKPSDEVVVFASRFPEIEFLNVGEEGESPPPIFTQYPAHIIPQAILVNPEGVLVRAAIRPLELSLIVNEELIKFERQQSE